MPHTISFVILDDLYPRFGPYSIEIESRDQIEEGLNSLLDRCIPQFQEHDPTYWFRDGKPPPHIIGNIAKTIRKEGYYVVNRCEKYYVIAFALDYARFEVFSKDCDPELIEWK